MNLVWPILAQVTLTLVLGLVTGWVRYQSVKRGEVRVREVALDNHAWPDSVRQFGNNFSNQFETPVLFYVLSGLAIYLGQVHFAMVVAAWGFVISRLIHATIHVGRNDLSQRFWAFGLGVVFLVAMFVMIVAALLTAPL
ncbi:hypothetical protein SAMN04488061_1643 [Filomicrobium insigne]|uniref:MAPEG family protein n=1 Tax=Filomicrobium insigne TaxID=418854 RepID=A0A1H0MCT2_9HYPH|nr:MAPEG family protein [Filomicrobium insigne]SDO78268.1 hypothetical protein SAMN04488061_1643 [Filomicrobium insigne]